MPDIASAWEVLGWGQQRVGIEDRSVLVHVESAVCPVELVVVHEKEEYRMVAAVGDILKVLEAVVAVVGTMYGVEVDLGLGGRLERVGNRPTVNSNLSHLMADY